MNLLQNCIPENMEDIVLTYSFCLSGCIGLMKSWLKGEKPSTPTHMAELTCRIFHNAMKEYRI